MGVCIRRMLSLYPFCCLLELLFETPHTTGSYLQPNTHNVKSQEHMNARVFLISAVCMS